MAEIGTVVKFAVSNIAWSRDRRDAAAALLSGLGVGGVEVAPTKIWRDPTTVTGADVASERAFWAGYGIEVVAMQSLLYGRDELTVFGEPEVRRRTLDYLRGMIRLAADLGATVLVFGSPKQRRAEHLEPAERTEIARAFFSELGNVAFDHGVSFCIEPNPPEYGTDFVNTVSEACDLIRSVGSEGFGLHLDTGGASLVGEDPHGAIGTGRDVLRHVHVSEPFLAPVGGAGARPPGPVMHPSRRLAAPTSSG
ncbi:MAG: sugar phosphate isomerase/epimerase family protein [Halobacteriales archaeon]|nr:sugar phosphate isomerase/epimerase family protein [Halobacteriales archaeon]